MAPVLADAGSIVVTSAMPAYGPTPSGSSLAALNGVLASSAAVRRLPVGRIGRTSDIADAIIALLRDGFMTRTILLI